MARARSQYIAPTLIVATALLSILATRDSEVLKSPVHPEGFLSYVPGPCQPLGPGVTPPPDDRDPQIYIRVLGAGDYAYAAGGELYYSWRLQARETRVGREGIEKLLADIFLTRAARELFIIFEGGTYTDLIRVVDAFYAVPSPPSSPWKTLSGEPDTTPRIILLTERLKQEEISNTGKCIYRNDPPAPVFHMPLPPRPVPQPLRSPNVS